MICHMKVHIVSYNFGPKKISKSKIHILPNYEQTDLKTAIVILLEGSFYDLQLFSTLHTGSRAHAVCKVERSKIRFSTSQTATVSSMKTLLRKLLTAYLNVKKAYF